MGWIRRRGLWLPENEPSIRAIYRVSNATVVGGAVSAITALGTTDPLKNLSQATTAKQPTYTASNALFNGQPTMEGTGSQYLDSGIFTNLGSQVMFIWVGKLTQSAAQYQFLLCDRNNLISLYLSNTQIMMGGTIAISGNYSFPAVPCVVCAVWDSANGTVYVNNSQTPILSGNIGATSCQSVKLSNQYTDNWGFVGSIAEAQLYASNSAEVRSKAMLDSARRYAIAGVR